MIDYIKDNYQWIGVIIVPIVVALIGAIAVFVKKSGRNQKVKDVKGNGNTFINGNVK